MTDNCLALAIQAPFAGHGSRNPTGPFACYSLHPLPVAGHTHVKHKRMRRQCCGGRLAYNSCSNSLHPAFGTGTGSTARLCIVHGPTAASRRFQGSPCVRVRRAPSLSSAAFIVRFDHVPGWRPILFWGVEIRSQSAKKDARGHGVTHGWGPRASTSASRRVDEVLHEECGKRQTYVLEWRSGSIGSGLDATGHMTRHKEQPHHRGEQAFSRQPVCARARAASIIQP